MDFSKKNILVCGLARSGQAALSLLAKQGARLTAQDMKKDIEWKIPPQDNIKMCLGKNPDDIIKNFDLVVISPGIPFDLPFLEKARSLNIPVWGEIELAYRFCPSPIIAITGTNGKTTVSTLVGEIMQRHNGRTTVVGNIGLPFTERVENLSPEDWVVAEVSSFQLETTHDFAPKISAVLNMTPDHLDRHKTFETYQYTKERIFAKQSKGDCAILGYDNKITKNMRPPCHSIFFSAKEKLEEGVFLDDGVIRARLFGKDFTITKAAPLRIMPENALAATALCLCAGVPAKTIAEGLNAFSGVPHRLEYINTIGGVEYYNDSKATNTDSAIKGIEAMKSPIILIGGGFDKAANFDDWVSCFEGRVKKLIVMGESAKQIIKTCQKYKYNTYEEVKSLQEAVKMAHDAAKPGDCVLLSPACASWDMFKDFEERGNLFKAFVKNYEI